MPQESAITGEVRSIKLPGTWLDCTAGHRIQLHDVTFTVRALRDDSAVHCPHCTA